jgi:hypothetical protein
MAQLYPDKQMFFDFDNETKIGVHLVTLQSASDTIVVPRLGNWDANNRASAQLIRSSPADSTGVTVTDGGGTDDTAETSTVTLTGGAANATLIVVTLHDARRDVNSSNLTVT